MTNRLPPRKVQYHFPVIAKGVLQMALIIKPMYPERFLRDMNYTPEVADVAEFHGEG